MAGRIVLNYVNLSHTGSAGTPEDRRRARLTYKERVVVHALRNIGWTERQISEHTGLIRITVHSILQQPTTPRKTRRPTGRRITTPVKTRLIEFVESSAQARQMIYG